VNITTYLWETVGEWVLLKGLRKVFKNGQINCKNFKPEKSEPCFVELKKGKARRSITLVRIFQF
jgi:hypothetical protein